MKSTLTAFLILLHFAVFSQNNYITKLNLYSKKTIVLDFKSRTKAELFDKSFYFFAPKISTKEYAIQKIKSDSVVQLVVTSPEFEIKTNSSQTRLISAKYWVTISFSDNKIEYKISDLYFATRETDKEWNMIIQDIKRARSDIKDSIEDNTLKYINQNMEEFKAYYN